MSISGRSLCSKKLPPSVVPLADMQLEVVERVPEPKLEGLATLIGLTIIHKD
jgi:hypothetical protein